MQEFFAKAGLNGRNIVLGIGVFDGVHLGHRKVLHLLNQMAKRHNAIPVAMSFAPHPRSVLSGESGPELLVSVEERQALLSRYGASATVIINFTPEFAQLPPAQFLDYLLALPCHVKGITTGSKWRFGAKAAGDANFLRCYCQEKNLEFEAVPELYLHNSTVSSSTIRHAITTGRLGFAKEMLGRNYTLSGVVEHGYQVASTRLSHPTANLHLEAGVLPPDGVYAVRAYVDGLSYPAAVNIGVAPTFQWDAGRRVEVHILDFSGNLYDKKVTIELLAFLRTERKFASAEELKVQINSDIQNIYTLFRGEIS